jgi:hypothetical protein
MRALGLVLIAAGLVLAPARERPDVLIGRNGATAALRSRAISCSPRRSAATYSVENCPLADSDDRGAGKLPEEAAFRCDPLGCIGRVKGKIFAIVRQAPWKRIASFPTSSLRPSPCRKGAVLPMSLSTSESSSKVARTP